VLRQSFVLQRNIHPLIQLVTKPLWHCRNFSEHLQLPKEICIDTYFAVETGMGRPTLKSVAEKCGFAVTTVSRALNDAPDLNRETKTLIQQVAREMGYTPNRAGVRLRTGRTMVIAFILNQEDEINQFARNMIIGISDRLKRTSYHLIVLPKQIGQDPMEPLRYIVETHSADGLIISHTQPQDDRVKYLLEHRFPFITHGRTELATPHGYVDHDNLAFAYEATRELIRRGRSAIALVQAPSTFTYASLQMAGYMRALYEAGLRPFTQHGLSLDSPPASLRADAYALGTADVRPDGFVCGSETRSLALLSGLQEAGLCMGGDFDILAKRTSDLLDLFRPTIPALTEDLVEAGFLLADALLLRIQGGELALPQIVQPPVWAPADPTNSSVSAP
jgi:LacI family transcriptional regulator